MTVLNRLVEAIRGADTYNRHDLAEPRVVLWTDGERQWSKVINLIQDAIPELLVPGHPEPTPPRASHG